jgi:excisionase family DNA binding protein
MYKLYTKGEKQMQKVYSVEELQKILGTGYRTILKLISTGKIKKLSGMGKIKVSEKALNDYLEGK